MRSVLVEIECETREEAEILRWRLQGDGFIATLDVDEPIVRLRSAADRYERAQLFFKQLSQAMAGIKARAAND